MRRIAVVAVAVVAVASCGQDGGTPATQAVAGSGISGVLRDESGQALAKTEVLACQATICQFGVTGNDGAFAFSVDTPAEVAIKTRENLSTEPARGSALYPVRLQGDARVDLDDVHIPTLPPVAPLGGPEQDPQTLVAGDGLELTIRRADLVSNGHTIAGVAARSIPPARSPELPDLGEEQVVAVYALHPFGVTSRTPIGMRMATTLPAGTEVRIRTISELDGSLSEPLAGTSDGSFITPAPGAGIAQITWLVVTR